MVSLAAALACPPDAAVALEEGSKSHRWGELRRSARRIAAQLPGEPGQRIGLLVEPGGAWLAALLGIWEAGGVALPLSSRSPDRELSWLLSDAGAGTVLISDGAARRELPGVQQRGVAELDRDGGGAPQRRSELALLLYTSGTTSRPKGVMLSDAALGHQAALLERSWQLSARTRLLHALPLHHMHGVAIALLPCLAAGGSVRMLPRFDAHEVWEAAGGANTFMGVPTMYNRLLAAIDRAEPASAERYRQTAAALELWVSGSAALPARLASSWRALSGAIPLERYGMTETGVICSNPLAPDRRREGSVGFLLPSFQARLLDDDGRELSGTGRGRLWVSGPSLLDGYWQRPDADAEALVDGWFDTGDIAERSDDGRMRLWGRSSVDILKSGGTKLSALEIEEALREHAAVAEVAVVGLPDDDLGQLVTAALVLSEPVDTDELRRFLADRIASYKIPRRFVVLDELPRNALGKVTKPALVAQLS